MLDKGRERDREIDKSRFKSYQAIEAHVDLVQKLWEKRGEAQRKTCSFGVRKIRLGVRETWS